MGSTGPTPQIARAVANDYTRSKMPAAPMPRAHAHGHHAVLEIVADAARAPRWPSGSRPWHPAGGPAQSRRPSRLTLAGSSASVTITASDCAAKASFSSIQSIWSCVRPGARSAAGNRLLRANPHDLGRHAPRPRSDTKRASGYEVELLDALFSRDQRSARRRRRTSASCCRP